MVLIIAEAGVNHNGDISIAKKLVDAAKDCGADIVKFQSFKAEDLVTSTAKKALYQVENTGNNNSQFSMLKDLELTYPQQIELKEYCNQKNIEFLSTGFDLESLNFLNSLGLKRFKIPSGEITNIPYLRKVGSMKKPLILSTGMSNLGEIENAIYTLEKEGTNRNNITVLHCTTEYPVPYSEVNLNAIATIREAFKVSVGYSDHTLGIAVSIGATSLGASIIEKHLTLDRNLQGPDHKASLEPHEFKNMVKSIRCIEESLGNGIKEISISEVPNRDIVRKSIVAAKAIRVGDYLSEENLTTKRPGTGISPLMWDHLIGLKSKYSFEPDELIRW